VKTMGLLGVLLLAGCASEPPAAPAPDPFAFAANRPAPKAPYIIGTSTEDELIAKRGAPISHVVADDGTRTDTYPALTKYIDFSGDKPKEVTGPRPGTNSSKINVIYIYSADGILRHIKSDIVSIGADGQEQHLVSDVGDPASVSRQ